MLAIKEMLKSWQESAPVIKMEPTLHERIKQLPQEEKTRKTIVIDQTIGERFDVFCEAERLNKSDILHLALADFMDKFKWKRVISTKNLKAFLEKEYYMNKKKYVTYSIIFIFGLVVGMVVVIPLFGNPFR